METLAATLTVYHMNTLKEMALHLKIQTARLPARKAQLVELLQTHIRNTAKSRDFIKGLQEAERATLALVLKHNTVVEQKAIALPLMLAGAVRIEGVDATKYLPSLKDVVLHLLRLGLLVNSTEPIGTSTRRTFQWVLRFAIAPEVRRVLPRELLKEPQPQPLKTKISAPAHIETGTPTQFLRQLFFVWAELRRQPAKRLKAGGMAKRDLRRIAKGLKLDVDNDSVKLNWLYAILQALNLVKVNEVAFHAAEGKAVKLFWGSRATSQLRDILQQYVHFDQVLPLDTRSLARYSYYSYTPVLPASQIRKRVIDMLQQVSQFTWVPLALFVSFLTGDRPGGLTIEPQTRNTIYTNLRWYASHTREQLDAALQKIDQQAAVAILEELRVMGIVDLGYAVRDQPITSFHVTAVAHAHFNNQPLVESDAEGQIILQPDFQILAMGPVPLRTLANLERFAQREKLDDSVITYRLTRDSIYQAFQRDETAASIQQFLLEATGQPVPQNVARSVEEWGGQYERIVLRRDVTIMQLDSAAMLDEFLGDKILKRYVQRLDAHTAWIRAKNMAKVEARLSTLALLPAYSQGPEADLPRSLRWQDDVPFGNSMLQSRRPLPSLYVTGTIRRIAAPVDGGWQLTPQTVQAAAATGMDIPGIIALLEKMTGSSLSPEWHKQLKAWGKHYGDGKIAVVRLLRLESSQTLRELRRADRRLSRWLRPLPKAEGLAVVNEKNWEEVQTLLAEWGVVVQAARWW